MTEEEIECLRCNYCTANISSKSRSLPYVFAEQDIYMFMTVLKSDLAIRQSIALIRLFKQMKDYIAESQPLSGWHGVLALAAQTSENTRAIGELREGLSETQEALVESMAGFGAVPFGLVKKS